MQLVAYSPNPTNFPAPCDAAVTTEYVLHSVVGRTVMEASR